MTGKCFHCEAGESTPEGSAGAAGPSPASAVMIVRYQASCSNENGRHSAGRSVSMGLPCYESAAQARWMRRPASSSTSVAVAYEMRKAGP